MYSGDMPVVGREDDENPDDEEPGGVAETEADGGVAWFMFSMAA